MISLISPLGNAARTVRMPDASANEFHRRWAEGVVAWELELGGENSAFEGCFFGALDQRFPVEHVIFGNWAGGYALGWVCGKVFVFVE